MLKNVPHVYSRRGILRIRNAFIIIMQCIKTACFDLLVQHFVDRQLVRAQEMCESQGGSPGLPVPDSPYGLYGHKATVNKEPPELRGCVKVKVAVLGSPSLIVLMVSMDIKQQWTRNHQSSGAVWKSRWQSWAPHPCLVLMVSMDIKQQWTRNHQSSGAVWKSRWQSWAPHPCLVLMVSMDIKQQWTRNHQSSGAVWKSRWQSWAPHPW